jgi:hypothetical protein
LGLKKLKFAETNENAGKNEDLLKGLSDSYQDPDLWILMGYFRLQVLFLK